VRLDQKIITSPLVAPISLDIREERQVDRQDRLATCVRFLVESRSIFVAVERLIII